MKFYIKKIVLWLENNTKRELGEFKNNKVNIITGDPATGKSSILSILDYCFLSSNQTVIQGDQHMSQVQWFGISFQINDKNFVIARHKQQQNNYYFSSSGEIPQMPSVNMLEKNIKTTLQNEFSIDNNVKFPFGGQEIRKNTRISHRYFMLFNTQTRDVLSHAKVLFDKQTDKKYSEALTRILDIALGVTTIDNLIKIETLKELENKKNTIENKIDFLKKDMFSEEKTKLIDKAKSLNIIPSALGYDAACKDLSDIIEGKKELDIIDNSLEVDELQKEKIGLKLKLSKYKKYINQYNKYKSSLKKSADSLKPIEYINSKMNDVLNTNNLDNIIGEIEKDLISIKNYIEKKDIPAINDLNKEIGNINNDLENIENQINNLLNTNTTLESLRSEQLIFLGEFKNSLRAYNSKGENIDYTSELENIKNAIQNLKKQIEKTDRTNVLDNISEYMQEIFKEIQFTLKGYDNFKPIFDYKSKLIQLKKIDKIVNFDRDIENIGSSSNHLFLHLAFFSALHKLFIKQQSPSKFIPQFLIVDQPDSPFYTGSNKENNNEKELMVKALKILDNHIQYFQDVLQEDFQIIVLEHIEWSEIVQEDFKHYHLVEEWRGGNGLVPKGN